MKTVVHMIVRHDHFPRPREPQTLTPLLWTRLRPYYLLAQIHWLSGVTQTFRDSFSFHYLFIYFHFFDA
jgi:hypothetical protein